MKEISNIQGSKILLEAVRLLKSRRYNYMCPAIKEAYCKITKDTVRPTNAWDVIPELLDHIPEHIDKRHPNTPWFGINNISDRVNILMKIYIDKYPSSAISEEEISKLIYGDY